MRLGRRSTNIEDRRGMRMGPAMGGGIGGIAVLLIALFLGVDPGALMNSAPQGGPVSPEDSAALANDPNRDRVAAVLGDTEDTWNAIFKANGQDYEEPKLVLFTGSTPSACGTGQAAMGPFYCQLDRDIYIDLSFFDDLRTRFKANGDFAQAYVIAHEVGHHVQNQLGISERTAGQRQRAGEAESNRLSVMQELQADCFAGIWANHANRSRQILEAGDIEEGLNAAAAIGDDRIQRQTQGTVVPESFTHGSSEQRVRWFKRGIESGDVEQCDTFNARAL
ncbi:MAG: zinc metallopeptidase [Gemmatimonadaceae bacterium]|nr:zinc metallopeptidase [Gemmatimonadaceae bacterium]